jgi:hypothetical protein
VNHSISKFGRDIMVDLALDTQATITLYSVYDIAWSQDRITESYNPGMHVDYNLRSKEKMDT